VRGGRREEGKQEDEEAKEEGRGRNDGQNY